MGTIKRVLCARWTRPALATAAVAAVATLTAIGVTGTATAGTSAGMGTGSALGTASVPPGGTWGTSTDIPGVAALAAVGSSDFSASVSALTCSAPRDCIAVGSYSATVGGSYTIHPYIASEVSGVWGKPIGVTVPGTNLGLLNAVSCPSEGNCAAAGQFYPTSDLAVNQPFVVDEENGTWETAQPVTGVTSTTEWQVNPESISCGAAGDCALVGTYTVPGATGGTSNSSAYVASEAGGSWQPAQSVTGIPYPASITSPDSYLTTVSCGAAGDCAAGGYFGTGSEIGDAPLWPLLITEHDGTWLAPQLVPGLPGPTAANSAGEVTAVSCTAAGDCTAAGQYASGSSPWQAFLANESSSTWAGALTVPAIEGTQLRSEAKPVAISCWSAGDCAMVGTYETSNKDYPFVTDESDGAITAAQQLPGIATLDSEGAAATALSCASDGYCAVGGIGPAPFVANRVSGAWTAAQSVDEGIETLSCPEAGWCTAGGSGREASTMAQATATTLTVKSSAPTLSYGSEQSETLTATVTGDGGTPTGTVRITDGTATICVITLSAGTGHCVLSATTLPEGTIRLAVAYSGDTSFVASAAGPWTLFVSPEASKTSFTISPGKVTYRASKVTYSVKVSPAVTGVPTGKVSIEYLTENASHDLVFIPICTATLSGGKGTCATAIVFPVGGIQTYALYNGDGNFTSSQALGNLTVVQAASAASLTPSRSSVAYGHENGEKLSVKVTSPQGGTPAGTVTIKTRSTVLCTIRLANGAGSCTLSSKRLNGGTYPLTASYGGSTDYARATSATKTLKVTG